MKWKKSKVYAVKHKNEETRAASRSGGIFTALSDDVLLQNGVVYGCVLTLNFEAVHIRAEKPEDRDRMRGSKYIQSNIGDVFRAVAADLQSGRMVLFSGTSCQVAGLRAFLNTEYENLLCVDIVCHGVPSPLVWNKYLSWQEAKHGKIVSVDFRNKKEYGWADHVETLTTESGVVVNSRVFTKLFYGHSILRPSCYKCPYKDIMHPGDITIADYWGIDKAAPGFNDNKGVSLVLVNNEMGDCAFNRVKEYIEYRETRLEDSMQPPFIGPFEEPKERTAFWDEFYKTPFEHITKKYGGRGWKSHVNKLLGKMKRKLRAIIKGY